MHDLSIPWVIFQLAVTAALSLYTWSVGQRRAERGDLDKVREDSAKAIDAVRAEAARAEAVAEKRAQLLELEVERLKAQQPHVASRGEMAAIQASIESMRTENTRVQRTLDRIENFLQHAKWGAAPG